MFVPKGLLLWLLISNIIICIDVTFIFNRPESLMGGQYEHIYWPYQLYYRFDKLFDMNHDPFVVIICWMNLVEAAFAFVGIGLCLAADRGSNLAEALICLLASVMVFWKTVIFLWYDRDWLINDALNYTYPSILFYYIPNYLWIFFPLCCMIKIPKNIFQAYMDLIPQKHSKNWSKKWSFYCLVCLRCKEFFGSIFI